MAFWDFWSTKKDKARENNYKLDLFETVAQSTEVADMSAIKKYFNRIYDAAESNFNTFNVNQNLDRNICCGGYK